jgi:hypothetical protein
VATPCARPTPPADSTASSSIGRPTRRVLKSTSCQLESPRGCRACWHGVQARSRPPAAAVHRSASPIWRRNIRTAFCFSSGVAKPARVHCRGTWAPVMTDSWLTVRSWLYGRTASVRSGRQHPAIQMGGQSGSGKTRLHFRRNQRSMSIWSMVSKNLPGQRRSDCFLIAL